MTEGYDQVCLFKTATDGFACFDVMTIINLSLLVVFCTGAIAGGCAVCIWERRKTTARDKTRSSESGNVFFALFAAVAMVGALGASMNVVMRGPVTAMATVTKRTIAENNIIASGKLAIVSATIQQANSGDCDADSFVEPIPYRDAGAAPHPLGGGYIPTTIGSSLTDPWQREYGYCVWDHGAVTVSNNNPGCGGSGARRLNGAPTDTQFTLAIISAGPDMAFQTKCNAFVDANTDSVADVPLIEKPGGSDDIVLGHTYAEANTAMGGLWGLKSGEPDTATINKDIEVDGNASFGGSLVLGGGLLLPDETFSGACSEANDQQLRRNVSGASTLLEICDWDSGAGDWTALGGDDAGSCVETGTWTAQDSSRNWSGGVASSADGAKLVAVVTGGQIYTSSDSGATWTARATNRGWHRIASSSDGTKLAATVSGGQIYTSSDSGATWTARATNQSWIGGVASSSDGTKLVAPVTGGQIYTSVDSGATWTARETTRDWTAVASSSNGTKLVAAVTNGQIYTSIDSGFTWTARATNRNWSSIASSSDGAKLVAAVYGGQIYTSTDSGATWTARESSRNWRGVASSSDGAKLVAVAQSGQIYRSSDSGVTWTPQDTSRTWYGVASSANGTKLVAAVNSGQLYTTGCDEGGSGSAAISALTAATATNTIDNGANTQVWNWDAMTSGNGLVIGSTSVTNGGVVNITASNTASNGNALTLQTTSTSGGNALRAIATGASGANTAVSAQVTSTNGTAVSGVASGTSAYGVYGTSPYIGVQGMATANTNNSVGVQGHASGTTAAVAGVYGTAQSSNGWGVRAVNGAGTAIMGESTTTSGGYAGGSFTSNSATGYAGFFDNTANGWGLYSADDIGITASKYLNWGGTRGSTGYGIRDNAGIIEVKNSGGAWAPPGGAPGGSNTHVQFNNNGAFGGSANFTWSGSTVAVTGAVQVSDRIKITGTAGLPAPVMPP